MRCRWTTPWTWMYGVCGEMTMEVTCCHVLYQQLQNQPFHAFSRHWRAPVPSTTPTSSTVAHAGGTWLLLDQAAVQQLVVVVGGGAVAGERALLVVHRLRHAALVLSIAVSLPQPCAAVEATTAPTAWQTDQSGCCLPHDAQSPWVLAVAPASGGHEQTTCRCHPTHELLLPPPTRRAVELPWVRPAGMGPQAVR